MGASEKRDYKVTVSFALGRSGAAIMQDATQASERARVKIEADGKKIVDSFTKSGKQAGDALAKGIEAGAKKASTAAMKEALAEESFARKMGVAKVVAAANSELARSKAAAKGFDERLKIAQREQRAQEAYFAKIKTEVEKDEAMQARAATRAAARQSASREKIASGRVEMVKQIASNSMHNMGAIASKAMGVGRDIVSGTGVNFDIGSGVAKSIANESLSTQISNSAYQAGGPRESAAGLVQLSGKVAQDNAMDPNKVLQGLAAYQGKTGDLATAKAGIAELSKLAKATYTDINDMISASGDVGNALGEVGEEFKTPEEKAAAIARIMKVIAAQGQAGAVEIKDLATQMAKLSAASGAFGGNKETNLEQMGALAQFARSRGGAASATAAATSVVGFTNTIKTPSRQNAFAEMGIDVFDPKETGKFKSPFALLMESLDKEAMHPKEFKQMWASVVGAKPAEAAATVYRDAENKKAGTGHAAVEKMMAEYMKPMENATIDSDHAAAMGTTESKAQLFQNQLDKITNSLANSVLPQMEILGPKLLTLADAFGKIISWAAENPGEAIVVAIVASIAKASMGAAISTAMSAALKGAAGAIAPDGFSGFGVGKNLGAAGNFVAAIAIFAAAVAVYQAGTVAIDKWFGNKDKGVNASVDRDAAVSNALTDAHAINEGKGRGGDRNAAIAELEKQKAQLEQDITRAQNPTSLLAALNPFSDKTFQEHGKEQADAGKIGDLKISLEKMSTELASLKKGLKVEVTNLPPGGMAPGGRVPTGGAH